MTEHAVPALLQGRRAVVVGTGDIGGAIAVALVEHGASVRSWDRTDRPVEAPDGVVLDHDVVDISNPSEVASAAARIAADWGGVDIVVNSAAIARFGFVEELDPATWNEVISVNLTGTFLVCRELVPILRSSGGGSIINISSVGGLRGEPEFSAYCAAKFGVIGFTQSLAREVGRDRIRVNAVCPGAVDSSMNTETMQRMADRMGVGVDHVRQAIVDRTSLRRLIEPVDIAGAVVYLASDLSAGISAESLVVAGGVF